MSLSLRIALVEDDPIYRHILTKTLLGLGCQYPPLVFADGRAFLDFLLENKQNAPLLPDLVISDVNMPVADLWLLLDELTLLLNELAKKPRIFAMTTPTAEGRDEERLAADSRIWDFAAKPLEADFLQKILAQFSEKV